MSKRHKAPPSKIRRKKINLSHHFICAAKYIKIGAQSVRVRRQHLLFSFLFSTYLYLFNQISVFKINKSEEKKLLLFY